MCACLQEVTSSFRLFSVDKSGLQIIKYFSHRHKLHRLDVIIDTKSEKDYNCKLIEKTEHLCKRMRWKAYFFFNPNTKGNQKETFGFNSKYSPPQIPAMLNFEKKLLNMVENIKFRKVKCWFQQKLSSDIKTTIKNSDKLLIPADKTTNFYNMDTCTYNDLLQKNITKTYKKVTPSTTNPIELEAQSIAKKLDLDDRINITAKREAFVTLKDHKPNFVNNPTCRLINPAKSEIGKISKEILDRINTNIIYKLSLNQWKNTKAVLSWFNGLDDKDSCTFIAFDVVDFYPSISIDLLNAALDFASSYVTITDDERRIILHAKKSLLYNLASHGERKHRQTSSMSVWAAMTGPNHVSSLVHFSYTKSERNMATTLAYTEMTALV